MEESSETLSAGAISGVAEDSYSAHSLTWYQNAFAQHSVIQPLHRASIHGHSQRRFVSAKAPLARFIARFVLMPVPSVRL